MANHSRIPKATIAIVAALLTIAFAPVLPNPAVQGDPTALPDARVLAKITSKDLAQMLHKIRGSRFVSVYHRYWIHTSLPLLSIRAASPIFQIGPGQATRHIAPPGEIKVVFGNGCQPECQEGVTYYFTKHRNNWRIAKVERWVE